jgi:hypothetical protein
VGERGTVIARTRLERLDDGADGQGQVRARVAVGHRVDVEVVDPGAGGIDLRLGAARERQHARPHAVTRTSSTNTSTASTASPVSRSTS